MDNFLAYLRFTTEIHSLSKFRPADQKKIIQMRARLAEEREEDKRKMEQDRARLAEQEQAEQAASAPLEPVPAVVDEWMDDYGK